MDTHKAIHGELSVEEFEAARRTLMRRVGPGGLNNYAACLVARKDRLEAEGRTECRPARSCSAATEAAFMLYCADYGMDSTESTLLLFDVEGIAEDRAAEAAERGL